MEQFSTYPAFKHLWISWRILGAHPFNRFIFLYVIYSGILNTLITVCYPLTLSINLFFIRDFKVLLENLTLNITDICCSLKLFNIIISRNELLRIKVHVDKLDNRVKTKEEKDVLNKIVRSCHKLFYFFCALDYTTVLSGGFVFLFVSEPRLMYPAWFPFDWNASHTTYLITYFYQFSGVITQAAQQIAQDTFPPMYLYVLTGHLEALTIRLSRIGNDPTKSLEENYTELVECIIDYTETIEYAKILQNVLSIAIFAQIVATGGVQCVTAVYVVFTNKGLSELIYLGIYFSAVTMEIAISCYFGSLFSQKNSDMTTAVYNCNWVDQSPKFKKAVIIFMQRTQQDSALKAGNWINVNLPTFLLIVKSAYSLFAVLNTMKSKFQ